MGKGNLALGKRKPRLGQVTLVDIYIYIYIEASSSSTVLLLLQKMSVRTGSLEYIYITIKLVDGPLAVAEDEGTDRLAGVQEVETSLDVDGKAGTVGRKE